MTSLLQKSHTLLDLDPDTAGLQTFTTPLADTDGDGVRDVDQALMSLSSDGGTNFEAGLQQATVAIQNAGTGSGDGNVIFLSDGFPFGSGNFADEVDTIRNDLGQNLRAFGVGSGSSLDQLLQIDPNAEQFTDINDLLDLFSGAGGGTNQDSDSTEVIVNNVAPTIAEVMVESVFIDDDDNDDINYDTDDDEGLLVTVKGTFTDPGILDTHTGEAIWSDGVSTDLTIVGFDSFTGSFTTTRFLSEDVLEENFPEIDDDNNNFPGLDDDDIFKVGVNLTITDDDTGTDTQLFEFFAAEEGGIFVPEDNI